MSRSQEKITRHTKLALKKYGVYLNPAHESTKSPVFILGYGRSGTSMLLNIFAHDMRVETMGENDPRIAKNYLLDPERLGPAIAAVKPRVIVLKPILDSFRALDFLLEYPNGKVIWVIRNYADVISSALRIFGDRVAVDMRKLVETGDGQNWISLGMPDDVLQELRELDIDDFGNNDWMGLVWWAVNHTVLRNKLREHDRFMLVRYEELVTDPQVIMKSIYDFIGLSFRRRSTTYINPESIGKGRDISVHPVVKELCDRLTGELYA